MTDYRDKNRWSNEDLRSIARRTREAIGVSQCKLVDIVRCMTSGWVPTIEGRKRLAVEILPDEEMTCNDGVTEFFGDVVRMRFKASVWQKALKRDGRSIWTLAHELGHAVLCHRDAERARQTGTSAASAGASYINSYESSERMANEFASHFLIEESFIGERSTTEQIEEEFGVSRNAAEVRLKRRAEREKKESIKTGFTALLREIGVSDNDRRARLNVVAKNDNLPKIQKSDVNGIAFGGCQKCGWGKMIYVGGNKYKCEACGVVGDHLQDGDDFAEFL